VAHVQTQEVEQPWVDEVAKERDAYDEIVSEGDDVESGFASTFGSTLSTSFGDFSSSGSDLDQTISASSSLPSTPRECGVNTPSPNTWSGGFFTEEFRAAIEEASKSSAGDENVDADNRMGDFGSQSKKLVLPQIKIKNTFIEIKSPMTVANVRVGRQVQSLPTTPLRDTILPNGGACSGELENEDQAVFQWSSAAIATDSCVSVSLSGPDDATVSQRNLPPSAFVESQEFVTKNTFIHIPPASPGIEVMCPYRSLPVTPCMHITSADLRQHSRIEIDACENPLNKECGAVDGKLVHDDLPDDFLTST
jgi:hypothetical protein